jgi:WD40 repeat protein
MLWLTCFDVLCLGRLDSEGRFVTGSYDKQLITWHMERRQPESVMEGLRVTDLAVSQDGTRLVLVTPDKKIKIYSLPSMSHMARAIPQVLGCLLMRTCTLAMLPHIPCSTRCEVRE